MLRPRTAVQFVSLSLVEFATKLASATHRVVAMHLLRIARTRQVLVLGAALAFLAGSSEAGHAWQSKLYGGSASPVLANGALYVGTADGALVALDASSGATLWTFPTGQGLPPGDVTVISRSLGEAMSSVRAGRAEIVITPIVAEGALFLASEDRSVYSIDARTGSLRWKFEPKSAIVQLGRRDSLLYVVSIEQGNAILHALATSSGRELWRFSARLIHVGSGGEKLYLCSSAGVDSDSGFVHALEPGTGKEQWRATVPGESPLLPVYSEGTVFTAITSPLTVDDAKTWLFAFDASSGALRWKHEAPGRKKYGFDTQTEPLMIKDGLAIMTTDKVVHVLDAASGALRWSQTLERGQDHVVVAATTLIVTARKLAAFDLRTGAVHWEHPCGDCTANFLLLGDGILFTPAGKKIEAVDIATGESRWSCGVKKQIHARPALANGLLYVSTWAGRNKEGHLGKLPAPAAVVAIDPTTGKY